MCIGTVIVPYGVVITALDRHKGKQEDYKVLQHCLRKLAVNAGKFMELSNNFEISTRSRPCRSRCRWCCRKMIKVGRKLWLHFEG